MSAQYLQVKEWTFVKENSVSSSWGPVTFSTCGYLLKSAGDSHMDSIKANLLNNADNLNDQSVKDDNGRPPIDDRERTILAVGDLHGDYFRLLRYLRELNFLLPGTTKWNPAADRVDLIFIGDYVDWRGEPLESSTEQSPYEALEGPRHIIELIVSIKQDMERLRHFKYDFDSRFYPILGNHDLMMMESANVINYLTPSFIQNTLLTTKNWPILRLQLSNKGLNDDQIEESLGFVNWWCQGGEGTAEGFGGLDKWAEIMHAGASQFLEDNLYLGVVVNGRLFSHSVPDSREFWIPMQNLAELPESSYLQARESFIWGRKVWGYDYQSGTRTRQFTDSEMTDMLDGFGCNSCVIGHTPLSRDTDHVKAYDDRVINIDVHGSPGSKAFVETYTPNENSIQAPLRSLVLRSSEVECRVL